MVIDEKAVFGAALVLPGAKEREAYLQQACAGQPELLVRLRELLAAHDESQGPLDHRPVALGVTMDAAHAEGPGTVIGPYKLLQQIGEGGMGTVFMAEQTEPVKRMVALKVIKRGMDNRQVIARFEAERQALAMMDHVNIARVFDGGTTGRASVEPSGRRDFDDTRRADASTLADGRPYFVMELVHGVPITKYCDDNHLTPRERLELFVPVCQAIQHAHQKGIIHRDIKPSNVMVTLYDGKPVPKVIDFGVAKATEQKLTERTLFTQYGTMVGTLEYMSPEQAEMSALGVDTRSDIYSLGVLLYELLTGSTPLTHKRMKEAAYAEILRMIKEEEPPKPSTRLSDSGEALASISALRKTEPTKLTKLVRGELDWIVMKCLEKDRNRRYETANGFAQDVQRYLADEPVLACPPSVDYRLRKFVRRNRTALAVAGLVLFFLVVLGSGVGWSVLESSRKLALTGQGIRQALERASQARSDLHAALQKPGGVQALLNQPARWELFFRTTQAELAQARRLLARAEGDLDAELTQGMDRLEQQLTSDEADYRLAMRLEKIRLDRATLVEEGFDNRTAAREYSQAFAEFGLPADDPATVAARVAASPIKEQLVGALDDWTIIVGVMSMEKGLTERLLAVARLAAPDSAWGDRLRQWNVIYNKEAVARLVAEAPTAGLSPQALLLVGVALRQDNPLQVEWLRRAQAQHPTDFWLAFHLALALHNTDPAEAAGFYRTALALRPTSSATYHNLGNALVAQGKQDEAIAAFRKAIALVPNSAKSHYNLGNTLLEQKKLDEAIAAFRKAIALVPNSAKAHTNLGNALGAQGKQDEAIVAYRKAIDLDPKLAQAHNNLGNALREQKKLDDAIAAFRKAIDLDPKHASAHYNLGIALREQKKLDDAIAAFRKAIEIDPKAASAHIHLGDALSEQKKLDDAIAAFRKAIDLDPKAALAHYNLGNALREQKKLDDAIAAFRKAIDLDPKHASAHYNLGNALREQKKLDDAIAAFRKAIDLDPKHANAHINLGSALREQKKLDDAIAAFRKGIDLDPKHARAHGHLGNALREQKKLDDAIAAYRNALAINPANAEAHCNLGLTLQDKGQFAEALKSLRKGHELGSNKPDWSYPSATWVAEVERLVQDDPVAHYNHGNDLRKRKLLDEAITAYNKALAINPAYAEALCNLGLTLREKGQFAEALAALKKGHELGSKQAGWSYPSAKWVADCEPLARLDARLPAILQGKEKPKDLAEQSQFALLCARKGLPTTAARLYHEALTADPKRTGMIFPGACAAALAGCGKGGDAAQLDERQRARWRQQALDWLRVDLAERANGLSQGPAAVNVILGSMRHWLAHPDLAGVRDAKELDDLPREEREAWQKLWGEVRDLLRRAEKK